MINNINLDPKKKSLAYAFDWNPPSEAIAATLNERGQTVCEHGYCPCFVFCGVQLNFSHEWEPISPERRAEWFGRVFGLLFRDREREYDRKIICKM